MGTPAKKKTGTARLLELAAMKKPLVVSSAILSALSSIVSFVPCIAIMRSISAGLVQPSGVVFPEPLMGESPWPFRIVLLGGWCNLMFVFNFLRALLLAR